MEATFERLKMSINDKIVKHNKNNNQNLLKTRLARKTNSLHFVKNNIGYYSNIIWAIKTFL